MKLAALTMLVFSTPAFAADTCGDLNVGLNTIRELSRTSSLSNSQSTSISARQSAQLLSVVLSSKLQSRELSDAEREALQGEHEAACATADMPIPPAQPISTNCSYQFASVRHGEDTSGTLKMGNVPYRCEYYIVDGNELVLCKAKGKASLKVSFDGAEGSFGVYTNLENGLVCRGKAK